MIHLFNAAFLRLRLLLHVPTKPCLEFVNRQARHVRVDTMNLLRFVLVLQTFNAVSRNPALLEASLVIVKIQTSLVQEVVLALQIFAQVILVSSVAYRQVEEEEEAVVVAVETGTLTRASPIFLILCILIISRTESCRTIRRL